MDAIKTGKRLLKSALEKDRKEFQGRPPKWKETDEDRTREEDTPGFRANTKRLVLDKFVMDSIKAAAQKISEKKKKELEDLFKRTSLQIVDPDLTAPWITQMEMASTYKADTGQELPLWEKQRQRIQDHVHGVAERHKELFKGKGKKNEAGPSFTKLAIEDRQDILRSLSRDFAAGPVQSEMYMAPAEVARLRASYAYLYDSEMYSKGAGWSRFPWNVAMGELCAIKAKALGPRKTITTSFYEHFYIKQSHS